MIPPLELKRTRPALGKVGQRWQRLSSVLLLPSISGISVVSVPPWPQHPLPPSIVADLPLPLVAFS